MPVVRIVLEDVDDPEADRLLMQLRVDGDGRALRHESVFGVCGNLTDGGNRYPFVLMPDGTLDFGTFVKNETDRFWRFRWTGQVKPGERATVTADGDEYTFQITLVTPL